MTNNLVKGRVKTNMASGIYIIVNTLSDATYIGSSVDVGARLAQHSALLSAGRHYNTRLQDDWNAYGASAFVFDVLEHVPDHSRLTVVEQRYLDERKPAYNLARVATNAAAGVHLCRHTVDPEAVAIQRRAATAQVLALYEQLRRDDDISTILRAFDVLSLEGVMLMYEHRDLAIAVYDRGVQSGREFLAFLDAGYVGFYHETLQQIRARKGLRRSQDISDYMGSLETASNIFRAALARQLLADREVADAQKANATHHEAGDSVRALLMSKGIYPERLPTPAKSYQLLLREEEARQRILQEDQTGLWAKLLAGRDDQLGTTEE
jgi:hypothetical protein